MAINEMQTCAAAGVLRFLSGSRRTREQALDYAIRWEGGQFFSQTARWIMQKVYGVEVGDYSYGECFKPTAFPPGVRVGRYVSIGPDVRVFLRNHPMDRLSTHPFFYNASLGFVQTDSIDAGTLEMGHDSWIGARSVILKGCKRIGIGAVVGAGAVVTRDVPDFAIAVGNPAKVVRMRFEPEICAAILKSRWWEKSITECARHLQEMALSMDSVKANHPLLK
jgi:acetyltransferase-like isoleucine patch superfamily enzyme